MTLLIQKGGALTNAKTCECSLGEKGPACCIFQPKRGEGGQENIAGVIFHITVVKFIVVFLFERDHSVRLPGIALDDTMASTSGAALAQKTFELENSIEVHKILAALYVLRRDA